MYLIDLKEYYFSKNCLIGIDIFLNIVNVIINIYIHIYYFIIYIYTQINTTMYELTIYAININE